MSVENKIVIPESNIFTRFVDTLLTPFMWILGGFKLPLQETHAWHVRSINISKLKNKKPLYIKKHQLNTKYYHDSPLGLFHMPIFGGLVKYIALKVDKFDSHWHIIWSGVDKNKRETDSSSVHTLKIKNHGIKLLPGRDHFNVYAVDDSGKFLNVKIVGEGELGDGKFKDYRLF